ncbi:Uncharacterised protein [Klebsiella michiganensis]|uniref:Uncharacterized protein n=1 Tax=Klebsiella michiganensis TaxID=1134687 RepID=A0A7H4MZP7_9ENTR|nr:Uncharacterised protein [Klebsiella michiganensis]
MVWKNCLWKSRVMESTKSMPSRRSRYFSDISRAPPQAASTCSQIWCSAATAAISRSGSIAPASVVPAVATMAIICSPLACASAIFRFQIRHVHPREFVGFHQRHGTVAEAHQRHVLLHREVGRFLNTALCTDEYRPADHPAGWNDPGGQRRHRAPASGPSCCSGCRRW